MWLIIRNEATRIPFDAAQAMCWAEMSASVQWVATRATVAPSACASRSLRSVPIPGSSSTATAAFETAATAASISSSSRWSDSPYWIEEPPSPSPWVTSITSTPARSSPPAIAVTCCGVKLWRTECIPSRSEESSSVSALMRPPPFPAAGAPAARRRPRRRRS